MTQRADAPEHSGKHTTTSNKRLSSPTSCAALQVHAKALRGITFDAPKIDLSWYHCTRITQDGPCKAMIIPCELEKEYRDLDTTILRQGFFTNFFSNSSTLSYARIGVATNVSSCQIQPHRCLGRQKYVETGL